LNFEEAVRVLGGPMQPNDGEARNGWDETALTIYHAERNLAASDRLFNPPKKKPTTTTNAMRWVGRRGNQNRGSLLP